MKQAFAACGYDESYARVTLSNRPDLCEYQCNGAMAAAKAFLMMSAAVLLITAGFALLAQSAIALASAGSPAIAVMFGLVGAVALLGAGMAVLLKSLAPMGAQLIPVATAMLAMGAAVWYNEASR